MNGTVLGLLALLLAAAPQDAPPAPPPPAAAAADAEAKALRELLDRARPVVEAMRGRKFEKPPTVAPTTRDAFIDRYYGDLERLLGGKERVVATSRLLARLGVVPPGTDLRAMLRDYLLSVVAAQYDPAQKHITFLPGTPPTLQTMIHEACHALDDAHFDMSAQVNAFAGEFDRALAYGSLCEGNARSVDMRATFGEKAITGASLDMLRNQGYMLADMLLASRGKTPPALALAFRGQYVDGLVFAEHLRRAGGEPAVDAAFRSPPRTTEQILHPEKYLAGEGATTVRLAAPAGEARFTVDTTLGEIGAFLVLVANGAKQDAARAAAAGWAGDRIALVTHPDGREAVAWSTSWDTEADAAEFEAALRAALPATSGGEGPVRGFAVRGTTVDYVEAVVEILPDAARIAREATREAPPAPAPAKPAAPEAPSPPK